MSLEKYKGKQLSYLKKQKDKLDAYNTRESLINFRKNMLERQRIANYANEYEILRKTFSHSRHPHMTPQTIDKRFKDLEEILGYSLRKISKQTQTETQT